MKSKLTWGDAAFNVITYTVLAAFTVICIFPFYYIFINTISNNNLATSGKVLFYPLGLHLNNYVQVFKIRGLGQAAFISLARTALGTVGTAMR